MGLKEFTTQEAYNFQSFTDWNYEELDLNDSSTTFTDNTCDTNHTSGLSDGSTTDKKHITHDTNANIVKGLAVTGTGIPSNSYITAINNSTCFTINADVTATNANTTLTFNGGADSETSSYITSSNPAKKIVLYEVPGSASSYLQDIDTLTLTINGETTSAKKILIDATDLPFTLSGVSVTSFSVSVDQANITDKLAVLSFH